MTRSFPGPRFPVRVIEYTVTTPGKEASVFRLVTTLLDLTGAPRRGTGPRLSRPVGDRGVPRRAQDPRTQRGTGAALQDPSGVIQEIYGYLCVHYALRSLVGAAAGPQKSTTGHHLPGGKAAVNG
jgi:hypothetical protein